MRAVPPKSADRHVMVTMMLANESESIRLRDGPQFDHSAASNRGAERSAGASRPALRLIVGGNECARHAGADGIAAHPALLFQGELDATAILEDAIADDIIRTKSLRAETLARCQHPHPDVIDNEGLAVDRDRNEAMPIFGGDGVNRIIGRLPEFVVAVIFGEEGGDERSMIALRALGAQRGRDVSVTALAAPAY